MIAPCKLSICIPTLNRGLFIAATLDTITAQIVPGVEVVIVDGGSNDNTEQIVRDYQSRYPALHYHRRDGTDATPSNEGFDRDCDLAVELAAGEYCWLFTDDDLLVENAVQTVLDELADGEPDLLVVDSQVCDLTVERVLEPRRLGFEGRRDYGAADADAFLADAGNALSFVGGVIIRRACWQARDRASYYGAGFLHVCVIFQSPRLKRMRILGQSLIKIRMGNAAWSTRAFAIWMAQWPALIWSFKDYSSSAKARVVAREPWHNMLDLLVYRAYGSFNRDQYRAIFADKATPGERLVAELILLLPGVMAHVLMIVLLAISRGRLGSVTYNLLVVSPHSNWLSRMIGRRIGHILPAA